MLLEIITPDAKIYQGEVKSVRVPGSKGSFQILNNHAPIISTLDPGDVKVVDEKDKTSFYKINGGVIEVKNNHIMILSETA